MKARPATIQRSGTSTIASYGYDNAGRRQTFRARGSQRRLIFAAPLQDAEDHLRTETADQQFNGFQQAALARIVLADDQIHPPEPLDRQILEQPELPAGKQAKSGIGPRGGGVAP